MRTESIGMARFSIREAGKLYVDSVDDGGKIRAMWLPKGYQEKTFVIAGEHSRENLKINCHYSPIEGLAPEKCEGDISLGQLINSPDLPSAEERKIKFMFSNDFVIIESNEHESFDFGYDQYGPLLSFSGSAYRSQKGAGIAILKDEENLNTSMDNKNRTLSLVVETWPNTTESKDVDCHEDSSAAFKSLLFFCRGKILVS